jgi:glycine oxidase
VETFDVAVIGGGLIGCSIAFELARENLRVVVLDRQNPGREASWAAAGMLSPAPDSPRDIPLVPLAKESLRLYPEFVRAIEDSSGRSVNYTREGTLQVFLTPSSEAERDRVVAEHQLLGLTAEPISVSEARQQGSAIANTANAVAILPDECTVEPRLLMDAVLTAAQNRGVQIWAGCGVTSLSLDGNRCDGVIANGKMIAAKYVVLAAGCFSAGILAGVADDLRSSVPTRPVRGQMVALRAPGLRLERVLRSHRGYLVPRADGRIVAGSTTEETGFEKCVTVAGIRQILDSAMELCPMLAEAEILETWSGLRPGTSDDLPILGPMEKDGLIAATGHYRNGILLAAVTAKAMKEWITQGRVAFDAKAFSPLRFKNSKPDGVGIPKGASAIY